MATVDDLLGWAEANRKSAFALEQSVDPSSSYLGGIPKMPDGAEWPVWRGLPMSFLGQIYLPLVPTSEGTEWLPRRGRLLFFYDADQSTWGSDPSDKGGWQVRLVDETQPSARVELPDGLPQAARFKRKDVQLRPFRCMPSYDRLTTASRAIPDETFEVYQRTLDDSGSAPEHRHQLLGWPMPIQHDEMEWQCQCTSNGYSGTIPPPGSNLEAGVEDWQLLLQLDSDDDIGMLWGDVGSLYFWVRRQDAQRGDFSNVWMVFQCY